jgi:hypothetical protein
MDLNLRFINPDPWKTRHYDTYHQGRVAYKNKQVKAELIAHPDQASFIMGQYFGALALVKAGYVTIEGPKEFLDLVHAPNQDDTPMWVVGLITTHIADVLEASANAPLPDWMKKSSDTSSQQTDTTPLER